MKHACVLAIGLISIIPFAYARTPDGMLDQIIIPNNGVPALITPGSTFIAELSSKAELRLAGSAGTYPVETTWQTLPGNRMRARCAVNPDIPIGTYALEATVDGHTDANARSVYVLDAFPADYAFVHITDVHTGSDRHPRPSQDILRDMIAHINAIVETSRTPAAPPAEVTAETAPTDPQADPPLPFLFVAITGDLTENGETQQFQDFIKLIDTCLLPTFVCAGNHDRLQLNYEAAFGPQTYRFYIGDDGYLVFDTKDYTMADEAGPQDADLEAFRQELMPCRWSIGLTHRYEAQMGMRSQLTLFVDNPLDWLFYGHTHRENTDIRTVPWGETPITITPAAINGALRIIDIRSHGIFPKPYETPVNTGSQRRR